MEPRSPVTKGCRLAGQGKKNSPSVWHFQGYMMVCPPTHIYNTQCYKLKHLIDVDANVT